MKKRDVLLGLLIILLVTVGIVLAQDGGEVDEDVATLLENYTFRPIDDIVDTDLIVTNFASDGTATLPIVTSVPVACTMVYGTTPEFGQLTLDQDMAGGTHSEHNPLLTGLEPDTTYYFRVQGVDAQGIVYISEVMTFTTPPQDETEVTNLLSPLMGAQVIGYSSAFGDADSDSRWGIGSAFDGSSNSAWSSAGDGDDAWVEVQLGQRSLITGVEFWTRAMSDGTAQVFEFTVTTDSGEVYGPFTLPDADQPYAFEVEFEATTLRFDVTNSSGGNTGAVEIAVYGEPLEDE